MIRVDLVPVVQYINGLPIFARTAIPLRFHENTLTKISGGFSYNLDFFQDNAAIVKVGELTITLNNAEGDFTPGHSHFGASDRDHRIMVYIENPADPDADRLIWQGYVKSTTLIKNASVRVKCEHEFNRFDDILIDGAEDTPAGDDEEAPPPVQVPFSDILDQIDRQLPAYLTPIVRDFNTYTSTTHYQDTAAAMPELMVYRPAADERGRDYMNRVLAAARMALSLDPATGKLVIGSIDTIAKADYATNTHRPALVIDTDDVISIKPFDIKSRMYNVIHATFHESDDDLVVSKIGNSAFPPDTFITRYGQRELELNMEHLTEAQAKASAVALQRALMVPRRRWRITAANPPDGITARDLVRLDIGNIHEAPILANGYAIVMGHSIDIDNETMTIEVVEIVNPTQGGTITIEERNYEQ